MTKLFKEKATILVVDDDADFVQYIRPALEREGFQVESANCGRDALTKAQDLRPQLILLDICLPDISGDVVAMRISGDSDLHKTPIIIITGLDSVEERAFLSQSNVVDYMVKPFDMPTLIQKIKKILK